MKYILEEKETLFNKLQILIIENKKLMASRPAQKKNKRFLNKLWGYFKRQDHECIDVSQGRVPKKQPQVSAQQLLNNIAQTSSFASTNPEFDSLKLADVYSKGKQPTEKEGDSASEPEEEDVEKLFSELKDEIYSIQKQK